MSQSTKIATCCYCGTRAALVLRGDVRHELACASCGAPLHSLKMLPGAEATHRSPERKDRTRKVRLQTTEKSTATTAAGRHTRAKVRKRKTLGRRFLKEAFDLLDDIFD